MNMKAHIPAALGEEFENQEDLLSGLSEEQIVQPRFDLSESIKFEKLRKWLQECND